MSDIFYNAFVVDETPHCLWTIGEDQNIRFLESIDPLYFDYVRQAHEPNLQEEGQKKHYAAIALRTAYMHGLETFFAFLCSALQAPHCTVGWMLKYRNDELRNLVDKIHTHKPILSHPESLQSSWYAIAYHIFDVESENKREALANNFGQLWKNFATDFLKPNYISEYNNIKHGMRVQMGGFEVSLRMEGEAEKERPFGGSIFGTTLYETKKLGNKFNNQLVESSLNWNPTNHLFALNLLTTSMHNVLTFLKIVNDVQGKVTYLFPKQDDFYTKPWEQTVPVLGISFNARIRANLISLKSKEEIIDSY